MIVVGAGNLGEALVNYTGFKARGFIIKALFDVNPCIIGMSIKGVPVKDIDEIKEFVKENDIDIAVLTLPKEKVTQIMNELESCGIKSIWNFTPEDLGINNSGVIVQNVHMFGSLMILLYRMNKLGEDS